MFRSYGERIEPPATVWVHFKGGGADLRGMKVMTGPPMYLQNGLVGDERLLVFATRHYTLAGPFVAASGYFFDECDCVGYAPTNGVKSVDARIWQEYRLLAGDEGARRVHEALAHQERVLDERFASVRAQRLAARREAATARPRRPR